MRLWGKKLDNDDILSNFYTKKKAAASAQDITLHMVKKTFVTTAIFLYLVYNYLIQQ